MNVEKYKTNKADFIRATKRILKENVPSNVETLEAIKLDIIDSYNNFIVISAQLHPKLDTKSKKVILTDFHICREKLIKCFSALNCEYFISSDFGTLIDPEIKTSKHLPNISLIDENIPQNLITEESNSEIELESDIKDTNMSLTNVEFLKLAASTINKSYGGDPLALQSFVDALNLLSTLATTADLKTLLTTFSLTKLEGKAREAIRENPLTVNDIITDLRAKIKTEKSKIIEGRMQALRADRVPLQEFAKKADELAENFKRALVMEGIPATKADEMTVDKTIEMCRTSARSNLVKAVIMTIKTDKF